MIVLKATTFNNDIFCMHPYDPKLRLTRACEVCVRGGFGRCEIFLNNIGYSWGRKSAFFKAFFVLY